MSQPVPLVGRDGVLLFGTFRNPVAFPAEYGFWDGASSRVGALLAGRDVNQR